MVEGVDVGVTSLDPRFKGTGREKGVSSVRNFLAGERGDGAGRMFQIDLGSTGRRPALSSHRRIHSTTGRNGQLTILKAG